MGRKKIPSYCVICFLTFMLLVFDINAGRPKFPDDMKDIIMHVHNTCVGKTGVSEADINKCEDGVFAQDGKLSCYMHCLMEEASFVNDDGTADYDMLISVIPDEWNEKVATMINKCRHLDTPEKEACSKAMEVHQCLYKADPELYFLF